LGKWKNGTLGKKKSLEELNRTIILFGEAATVSMGV
jgi:hypothetical protein